jgi:Zn-dependent alcohol dehydrogenase
MNVRTLDSVKGFSKATAFQGRLPFDRLVKYYPLDQINQAAEDSETGVTIKPIVRLGS